jgi:hypothetical protein
MARTQLPSAISTLIEELFGSGALDGASLDSVTHPLALEMAEWMGTSKRFRVFAETYRDKIRKKVRTIHDPEGLRDLQCELAVAYHLSQEPRFSVQYELRSAGQQRAPDFTILFKEHLPFHLEVTRLHTKSRDTSSVQSGEDARLVNTLCEKLGQMQPGAINVLAVMTEDQPYEEADVVATTRSLLMRATNKDEAYFAWHGFGDSRDFLHQYQRLSGMLLIAGWQRGAEPHTLVWINNQARNPIPGALLTSLRRMMSAVPNSD